MTMREYCRPTIEHCEAVQVTDATFDDPHPNPTHIVGVTYDPRTRTVIVPRDECGEVWVARVGEWIVREPGEPCFSVWSDGEFRREWMPVEEPKS